MTHCLSQSEPTQKKSPGGGTAGAGWSLALPNFASFLGEERGEEAEQEELVEEESVEEKAEGAGIQDGVAVARDATSALARSLSSWEGDGEA